MVKTNWLGYYSFFPICRKHPWKRSVYNSDVIIDEIKKTSKLLKLFDTDKIECLKNITEYILDMKKIWVSYERGKGNGII